MISQFHEFIRFPKRLSPMRTFSPDYGVFDSQKPDQYEIISMKRQMWAVNGSVSGIPVFYLDKKFGFKVIEGFRCERCNKTFFAAELDDFSHDCMEPG